MSVGQAGFLGHLLADAGLVGEGALGLSHLSLVLLDGLLSLVVSVVESNLQLIDITLQLLLGTLLKIKTGLYGQCPGMVLAEKWK